MSANFDFMKDINKNYYSKLVAIESEARIKPKEAAKKCRSLLEDFINDLFQKNNIEKDDKLYKNLRNLEENSKLGIPKLGLLEYDVIDMNGTISKVKRPRLYFVKELANAALHEGLPTKKGDKKVIISSGAVIEALRTYYKLFTSYYRNRIKGKTQFLESQIPLGKYVVSSSYVPVDTERSKCVRERAYKIYWRRGFLYLYQLSSYV